MGRFSVSPIKQVNKPLSTKRPRGRVHSSAQSRKNHKPTDYKARLEQLGLLRLQENNLAPNMAVVKAPMNSAPYGIIIGPKIN